MKADDVNKVIDHVAERLGEVRPLAETIVNEYMLSNMVSIIACILGIIAFIIVGKKFYKHGKQMKDKDEGGMVCMISVITVIIVSPFLIVFCILSLCRIVAPHYHILKDLLGK